MKVRNVHERKILRCFDAASKFIDGLASADDKLWPHEIWPAMELDQPLQIGAKGGHGPIRYFVKSYEPGKNIYFAVSAPPEFNGYHGFEIEESEAGGTVLRHVLEMNVTGSAFFSWPIIFRPLHDGLIENALEKAENYREFLPTGISWRIWVRFFTLGVRQKPISQQDKFSRGYMNDSEV